MAQIHQAISAHETERDTAYLKRKLLLH